MITLRGITWDHPRGYDPMVATAAVYADRHPDIRIIWDRRPLHAFGDRPLVTMAGTYDLMVIDHPHVGEAARQNLLFDFASCARRDEVTEIGRHAVGASHRSYGLGDSQWALAIDTATPVATWRPDLIDAPPTTWAEVARLAQAGKVIWALMPIEALMAFFSLARNHGFAVAEGGRLIDAKQGAEVLDLIKAIAKTLPERCLAATPIDVYEWMASDDEFSYSPHIYGYSNYARPGFRNRLLRFADMPAAGALGPAGSCLGGAGIAISAASKSIDVALDYSLWIAGAQCQKTLYFSAGGQPGHTAAWDDDICNEASSDFFRDTRATLDQAWVRPRHDGYLDFQREGGKLVNGFLRNVQDTTRTLELLESAYARSLRVSSASTETVPA